jgi:sugar lactone lactonase YvrE
VHVVLERVTVSNGLEWSPDGSRAYYNDTATLQVAVRMSRSPWNFAVAVR